MPSKVDKVRLVSFRKCKLTYAAAKGKYNIVYGALIKTFISFQMVTFTLVDGNDSKVHIGSCYPEFGV